NAGQFLRQTPAGDELHGEVSAAIDLTDIIYLHDVRMLKGGDRFGFAREPRQLDSAGELTRQKHLERDDAIQLDVPHSIDDPDPAVTEHFKHFVTRDSWNPRSRRRSRSGKS